MKLLDEFTDFLRFCTAKILTAPIKLLCWLQTHSLNPFRKKKKKEEPQATFAVSASYAITSSWTPIATTASYISGNIVGIQPMQQPSGQVFYMDYIHGQPGPQNAIKVHIQKD